jgi:nicotinamidase-related amidase
MAVRVDGAFFAGQGGCRGCRSEAHRRRSDRVPERLHLRGRRAARRGPGRDGEDRNAREHAQARGGGASGRRAPITFAPGYGELSEHPYGILKGVVDSTAFVKGEWGAEIVDALAPQEGDVVVEGKRGLDTFATTNLDFILRARGITTIALGGFLTNCCVESTMRTGYEKGYEVITLSDCVAATSPEEHENAIKFDYPMFSDVKTSQAFTEELQGAAVVSG